ncbi:hypothetical protein XENTR_v10005626 [Xenopus tropicalis]|nr:myoD family inhibitor [Xenopus tropicalis]KAE8623479.1 hypothetical protein XENTR_v10005626 [Xenopus tropicalis]KAE8623480.1 hypothetical protein XENTR_v10005626 [Xenopus tropicalis]|eukprot:XP_004911440.1 PREDICTED: myoD family inhibitor [Xenopus tropicalis]
MEALGQQSELCSPNLKSEPLKVIQEIDGIEQHSEISELIQESVVTEPPQMTHLPVTQISQIKNGSPRNFHLPNPKGPNKSLSQSNKQSSRSIKDTEPSYLSPESQEDCCVHCTLALLFCQFLSLCNLVLDVLTCGSCSADSAEFCCTCCSMGGCPDCSDSCDTDCGIVDACCESTDCLEICMECCGLCFSS